MRNEIVTIENSAAQMVPINYGSPLLNSNLFGMMLQLADMMAKSNTLPQHFHNKPGDCLRVIELAHRIGQSPYAIADGSYVIQGKFAMDGKTMASIVNSHPSIDGSLNYTYSGDRKKPESYVCTVSGRLRGETEPRTIDVTLALGLSDSKGARSRWEKDPDQMLAYYGARVWARRHAPEVIGGLYTPDELKTIEPEYESLIRRNTIKPIDTNSRLKSLAPVAEEREKQLNDLVEGIDDAPTLNELRRAYEKAHNFAKLKAPHALDDIRERKDKRKLVLENPLKEEVEQKPGVEHTDFIAGLDSEEDVPQ